MLALLLLATVAYAGETLTVEVDPARAGAMAAEWRERCDKANEGAACGNLGALHVLGKGVARDDAKAFEYYEKACRFGQPLRCLRAGIFALNGRGTPVSAARGAGLLAQGCRLLDPDNCIAYYAVTHGSMPSLDGSMKSLPDHPKADRAVLQNAATSLTLACDRGRANACGNLAGFYEEGDAVARDSAKALHYYERACELGEGERCARAGRYYANGEGSPADKVKAEKLFRRYCELKHELACPLAEKAKLGLPVELKLTKAEPPSRPAIAPAEAPPPAYGDVPPWALESPLATIPEEGLEPEIASKVRACNHGSARACGNAAASFVDDSGKPGSHEQLAFRLYAKACALGRAIRCTDLSRFYAHGWGTPVSKEREAAARKRACELGDRASCVPVPNAK